MTRARQVANFDPALFAADEVSGDKVSGGTIGAGTIGGSTVVNTSGAITTTGAFTSVGIDDTNADAVAITIDSDENVCIGTTSVMYDFGSGRNSLAIKGSGSGDYSSFQMGNGGTSSNDQFHGLLSFFDNTTEVSRIGSLRASNGSDAY